MVDLSASYQEVSQFEQSAQQWWDSEGEFSGLHKMNPIRLSFIKDRLCQHFDRHRDERKPFRGLNIIDVGCGGGLLCEPLSRLGAEVTGIDAGKNNIEVAKRHSKEKDVSVNYKKCLPEDVVKNGNTYDVVISLEVIEHVINAEDFVKTCCQLLNPGGVIIFSTLNRTVESLALAKVGAEFVFRLVPVGTHSWRKFIKPSELAKFLRQSGLYLDYLQGMVYYPLYDEWRLSKNVKINYVISAKKPV